MRDEIVKYKSSMNKVGFNTLNPREMNVFFAIVSRMRNKGTESVTFSYDYLMKLSNLNYQHRKWQFTQVLKRTYQKMLHLTIFYEDKNIYKAWVLFDTFTIDKRHHKVTIAVNPHLQPVLNRLQRWTRFSLREFTHLKSNYAKTALRIIKQWRVVGHVKLTITRFRQLMGIPKSYTVSQITQRIIYPVLVELIPIVKGLGVRRLRGAHNKTTGYLFTWTPEAKNKNDFSHGEFEDRQNMVKNVQMNGNVSNSIKNKSLVKITKKHQHTMRLQFRTTSKEPEGAFKRTLKYSDLITLKRLYQMQIHHSPLINLNQSQTRRMKRAIHRKESNSKK